jgi:hypothetical protein
MAYMRGDHYLWQDGAQLHLWAAAGYDGWDESVWAEGRLGRSTQAAGGVLEAPSGVGISQSVVDEYVAMRLAELIRERRLSEAIERALANQSDNAGCEALVVLAPMIDRALAPLSQAAPS